ncbi:MAG: hypothetical protein OXT65_03835 [Alphaproteobacteria bacterium]|nr:hypothetical protein [Alphaproteobacteria bacterium]
MNIIIIRAEELLDTVKKKKVAAVLSIEHPGVKSHETGYAPRLKENGHAHIPQKVLTFWDSETKVPNGPDKKQVAEGISFVMGHLQKGDVIIHCHAGKARSTGIALGVLALLHPDKKERELVKQLVDIRPIAAPNIIVVEHVDKITGRGGKLLEAVKKDPDITARREKSEEGRRNWLSQNPETARRMFPEKFPKL